MRGKVSEVSENRSPSRVKLMTTTPLHISHNIIMFGLERNGTLTETEGTNSKRDPVGLTLCSNYSLKCNK